MPGTEKGSFKLISLINFAVPVYQDFKVGAGFFHPCLNGGQCTKRDNYNPGIGLIKFVLSFAQLCDMLAAGNSAQVTQEHQHDMVTFIKEFIQGYLLLLRVEQGEFWSWRIDFHCFVLYVVTG